MALHIYPETAHDVPAIAAVTAAAFLQAPHTNHCEQWIVAALRAAGALQVSLVAQSADAVVGHIAASPVTLSDGSTDWFGIGPLSVLPQWQRQGIGAQLMHSALQRLQELGAAGCVVLGDPAYYQRFGFVCQPGLQLPGVPAAYFMALHWRGTLPCAEVTYHAGFSATA